MRWFHKHRWELASTNPIFGLAAIRCAVCNKRDMVTAEGLWRKAGIIWTPSHPPKETTR